jgi:hypothetical protein
MHQRSAHAATCDVARLLRAGDYARQSTSIRLSTSAAANFVQTSPCPRQDTLQLLVHMWVTLGSARKLQHLHGLANDRLAGSSTRSNHCERTIRSRGLARIAETLAQACQSAAQYVSSRTIKLLHGSCMKDILRSRRS